MEAGEDRESVYVALEVDELLEIPIASISSGKVRILASEGPPPVGDLFCRQFLDRVQISFTLSGTYDEIEVLRDGASVVVLDGTATNFSEPVGNRRGPVIYEFVARFQGASSIPISCQVDAKDPGPPPVDELLCDNGSLTWQNPLSYDSVRVFKNGVETAALGGDAQAFTDDEISEEQTIYTVRGELDSFLSPAIRCGINVVLAVEIDDVRVPLVATAFCVPVLVTAGVDLDSYTICLDMDLSGLDLVARRVQSPNATPEVFFVNRTSTICPGIPLAAAFFDFHDSAPNPEKNFQPTVRGVLFEFEFEIAGTFTDGDVIPVGFTNVGYSVDGQTFLPEVISSGEIQFGSAALAGVRSLKATVVDPGRTRKGAGQVLTDNIEVTWRNQDADDADDSGAVYSSDAIYILNYVLNGGPQPPAPFPICGSDPTTDSLGCDASSY